ncbi:NAD(P)/FAD-dependent oxidoreductase [Devosia sp. 1566]|uniref:NAD(P)/FAD-dependent oxidoreductase n=1 Tax=Devosia sp. 1566 TaxID=2499144 RepID=UPI000FD8F99C|nr:NAD(P)/FAD-dependent oxidoreductase [Devosia sp. 1566]
MDDVLVVGGSFAGLSAALQLGRARRKVSVLDTGLNRNRYADSAHNVLGHDGVAPGDILAAARRQLEAYPTVRLIEGRASTVSGEPDDFTITTETGDSFAARRLILSYGITDEMPPIPGFAEAWGKTVIHCPFCHGYEAGPRWGLLYSTPMSLHAPALYGDWTEDITLILDGNAIPDAERNKLQRRGVKIHDGKLAAVHQDNGQMSGVSLEDGTEVELDALYAHPRNHPSADLHEQLGLETDTTPTGTMVVVGERQATSREGVFAAGDLTTPMHSVTSAAYAGSMAAMGAQQSMLL